MTPHLLAGATALRQYQCELERAYETAVKNSQQFAEILLHGMLEDVGKMQHRLGRITDAAILEENAADEK